MEYQGICAGEQGNPVERALRLPVSRDVSEPAPKKAATGHATSPAEMGPRLIGREDEDVSQAVREILEGEGITVRTDAECITLAPHANGVAVGVDCTVGDPKIVGSDVLLAVGRRPNTDDLGLDKAGVITDARGYIQVDDGLATSVPGIWRLQRPRRFHSHGV